MKPAAWWLLGLLTGLALWLGFTLLPRPEECLRGQWFWTEGGVAFWAGETQLCGRGLRWDKKVGPSLEAWVESEVRERLEGHDVPH